MSSLFASLDTASQSLNVYQEALNNVQNNISNANTPGFASQSLNLVAQPYDVVSGLAGGVAAQGLQSAQDDYANSEVQRQSSMLGLYQGQAQGTTSIANNFDPSGTTGVAAQLSQLLQDFSAWSLTPNSASAQQQVLADAGTFAQGVQNLATSLTQTDQNIQSQIGTTVQQINSLASQIQQINIQQQQQITPDPGLQANLTNDLQQLSQLVNFSQIQQPDGMVTVILSGGTPLVVGNTQYSISATQSVPAGSANPEAPPNTQILDSNGNDITAEITGGQLGGLLDATNNVMASILGDGQQAGSLNTFAQTFADTVNGILESGTDSVNAGAANGVALFVYNGSDATTVAGSLAVNPNITPATLAPVDANGNSNGNALQLASLANSTTSGGVDGQTFSAYLAGIAAYVGNVNSTATTNEQSQQQIVTQTESQRDQVSAVSLDAQATQLMQFQQSYDATAQLIMALNSVMTATINMMQPATT